MNYLEIVQAGGVALGALLGAAGVSAAVATALKGHKLRIRGKAAFDAARKAAEASAK